MEIYHQYVKLRRQFGRWPKLTDEGAEMVADVRPNDEHAAAYVERAPVTTCAQVRNLASPRPVAVCVAHHLTELGRQVAVTAKNRVSV